MTYYRTLEEHRDWLLMQAMKLVGDYQAAEDLVQETLIVALAKKPPKLIAMRSWLKGILRNKCKHHLRRLRRCKNEDFLISGLEKEDDLCLELHRKDLREVIQKLVCRLPPKYRQILEMVWIQENSIKDAAVELSISENVCRKRLERARAELGKLIEVHFGREKFIWSGTPFLAQIRTGECLQKDSFILVRAKSVSLVTLRGWVIVIGLGATAGVFTLFKFSATSSETEASASNRDCKLNITLNDRELPQPILRDIEANRSTQNKHVFRDPPGYYGHSVRSLLCGMTGNTNYELFFYHEGPNFERHDADLCDAKCGGRKHPCISHARLGLDVILGELVTCCKMCGLDETEIIGKDRFTIGRQEPGGIWSLVDSIPQRQPHPLTGIISF